MDEEFDFYEYMASALGNVPEVLSEVDIAKTFCARYVGVQVDDALSGGFPMDIWDMLVEAKRADNGENEDAFNNISRIVSILPPVRATRKKGGVRLV